MDTTTLLPAAMAVLHVSADLEEIMQDPRRHSSLEAALRDTCDRSNQLRVELSAAIIDYRRAEGGR